MLLGVLLGAGSAGPAGAGERELELDVEQVLARVAQAAALVSCPSDCGGALVQDRAAALAASCAGDALVVFDQAGAATYRAEPGGEVAVWQLAGEGLLQHSFIGADGEVEPRGEVQLAPDPVAGERLAIPLHR